MAEQLTLQTLINQVKGDLFSPYQGTEVEGKKVYPLFFIDEVELELAVTISYTVEGGVKVTVLQTVEAGVSGGTEASQVHTMKIKMSPILSRDELRSLLDDDTRLMAGIRAASRAALTKGNSDNDIVGQED